MAEDFGVEGRGSFYDSVGALRDVVQNHLLQVVALLAMEPPVSSHPDALRDKRVDVLRAVRSLRPADVVRGQYEGYHAEPGVSSGSDTETFVAVRLEIDSWRWAGVPWIIRAGKGLTRTVTEAVVEFQQPPRPLFADVECHPGPNRLTFRTNPDDEIVLSMQAKVPGAAMVAGPIDLHLDHDRPHGRQAYDRLIDDAVRGDQGLFARQDGVMEAWRVVEGILTDRPASMAYRRGTWGPEQADALADGWIAR
jgi:glucose-6-phosphate 1-dehydrogenase